MLEKRDVKDLWYMIGTTVAVYCGIRYLLPLVVPFLFSYFFAKLVYPMVAKLKKKWNIPKKCSLPVLFIGILGFLGVLFFAIGKKGMEQFQRLVANLPRYEQQFWQAMEKICSKCDDLFYVDGGTTYAYINKHVDGMIVRFQENAMGGFSTNALVEIGKIFTLMWVLFIIIWGSIMIVKDMEELRIIYEESILCRHGGFIFKGLGEVGMAYGKSQLIIISAVFAVCSAGFLLIGNSYGILLGLFVSLFDALPIFGSGLVLIPWCLVKLFQGNWLHAAILFTVFVICQVIREWVEAKIIGNQIGIKPIYTIMSMYAGVQLFGLFGFILGPIALMIVKTVLKSQF